MLASEASQTVCQVNRRFEQRYYHPKEATPLEVLQHLMEARGVKQTHLWEVFGSKGIASEVLNGRG
jgi:HTH-type transcriptional regulator/antitoxin HigA